MTRIFFLAVLIAAPIFASSNSARITLLFVEKKSFSHSYSEADNSLVLEIQGASAHELDALDKYDENFVRRLVLKDLGHQGTQIKFVLKDSRTRVYVSSFEEPFRIVIDFFKDGFLESRDPQTGLIVNHSGEKTGHQVNFVSEAADLERPSTLAGDRDRPVEAGEKRRLLQPTPKIFKNPNELSVAMKNIKPGPGPAWSGYPPYVYRMQNSLIRPESGKEHGPTKAVSSALAMAEYASRQYRFGHENRALAAYNQVLHRDPTIFDKDAWYLWEMAETHLGQGNLTLARGYYQSIADKFPSTEIAQFAKLRILDVSAIRMNQQGRRQNLSQLVPELRRIDVRTNGELRALAGIRRGYWSDTEHAKDNDKSNIPTLDTPTYNMLAAAYPKIEWARTRFFAASLMLNAMVDTDKPWVQAAGQFASAYFKDFRGHTNTQYKELLQSKLYDKVNGSFQKMVNDGQLLSVIEDYEKLPRSLRNVHKNPKTAWALAEAYRKSGMIEKANSLYKLALKNPPNNVDRFKTQFWYAVTAAQMSTDSSRNRSQRNDLVRVARRTDREMSSTWNELSNEQRSSLTTQYLDHFEKTVRSQMALRTPARIVLSMWTEALSTKASAAPGETNDLSRHFSPTGSAVVLISDLAKQFSKLGMATERRQAMGILRFMKPADFEDDKRAKKIWTEQLLSLAEDYRKSKDRLEAGRLYEFIGSESIDWEGKARTLYQGGLLLFQAGRRQEAVAAFQKAADDPNDLVYAKLAQQRLSQLEE